ncbi:TonB-dependent siderophore receptor [Yersinia sp. J1]|uniref:TonB-dependent siderophore receptor n=1 Tax=Yersinia TaxID=629 RepID=UPI0007E3BF73|nr:TonB-dependent siderophore receptor [Yersinia entomophaga]OWF88633.1 TonB-dependent siderophore receptor [Yersinia entomophaga]
MKNNRQKLFTETVVIATALLSGSAYAAAETNADTMVISASRTNKTVANIAQTTWIIDNQQISEQAGGGKDIKEILAQLVPGMDVSSQGRTNFGMNMRGREMMVLIDGVRMNTSRAGSRQLDSIDPFNIERVEVLSGASALYGGGSIGGLVNIITKKGKPGSEFEFATGAKSGFNNSDDMDNNFGAAWSGGNEHIDGRLSASYRRFGGGYDGKGDPITMDITQTGLQYSDRLDLMANGGINLDTNRRIEVLAQYYKSAGDGDHALYLGKDFSVVTGKGGNAENRSGMYSDRIPGTQRNLLNFTYTDKDFFGQELLAQTYYRNEKLDFHPFPRLSANKTQVDSYSTSQQNTRQYGATVAMTSQLTDRWNLTYGADIDREEFDANQMSFDMAKANASGGMNMSSIYQIGRYPGYSVTNSALFMQTDYALTEMFTLNGGVRYQYAKNTINDFVGTTQQEAVASGQAKSADAIPGGTTSYDNLLFNAGVLAHLTENQQMWLNFSQAFQLPDIGKYYGQGNYVKVGDHYQLKDSINVADSRLQGIKTNSYELGWRYLGDNVTTQLAAYYTQSDKSINYNKSTLNIDVVDSKRRIYGIEGQVDYSLPMPEWTTGASFNLIRSENQTKTGWSKVTITEASPSKLTAYVGWTPGDWNLRVQTQQAFDVTDGAGMKLDGYNTVDMLGSYSLPVGKVSFSIENLLDTEYTTIWGQRAQVFYSPLYGPASLYDFKGRGRTFNLGYSVTF